MTRIVNASGVFTVDGTTVWVDTDNNRLGVVNPNPTVELDVIGDAEISGSLRISDAFTLPTSDGSVDQVLQTNGAGTLSWATVSGGGGVSIGDAVGSGTSGSILFVDASTNLAQDNSQLSWDNTNNRLGVGTVPSTKLHVNGTIRQTNATSAQLVADANGDLVAGVPTGQYQRYYLDASITGIPNGAVTQLPFSPFGSPPGAPTLYESYAPTTDFIIDPINLDRLVINADGLYQFTFSGFLAGITGGSNIDYRLTISTDLALGGDVLSFRNRTNTVDRYTGSGVATVFLTAGTEVFFSCLVNGRSYEIGGLLPPELRTFIDVRRVE